MAHPTRPSSIPFELAYVREARDDSAREAIEALWNNAAPVLQQAPYNMGELVRLVAAAPTRVEGGVKYTNILHHRSMCDLLAHHPTRRTEVAEDALMHASGAIAYLATEWLDNTMTCPSIARTEVAVRLAAACAAALNRCNATQPSVQGGAAGAAAAASQTNLAVRGADKTRRDDAIFALNYALNRLLNGLYSQDESWELSNNPPTEVVELISMRI